MPVCRFCDSLKLTRHSLVAHEATCPRNPEGYRQVPWNKGLTKETNTSLQRQSIKATGKKLPNMGGDKHPFFGKRFGASLSGHSESTKKKLSLIAKDRGLGGYVRGSGRGKKGWYKGFFCDSSYELAYIIYCLDHNIDIKRNTEKRQYLWQGTLLNYLPDFIVEGCVVEIKGYRTEQWKAKHVCNPDIKVLYKQDLKEVFEYVHNVYGKNFVHLYEVQNSALS